ncbi:hypothetical protein [Bdellovibrio svalbardensis]|uniref:Lipoprotein n=1 Tax=Bdellovibrio svalbardensis TaxID=2972972 RepID=A0ABT6DNK6_9BACT|nr:hypothetical protein [Bdellovibrio svalbardensis]MDG0817685.1 hypothetical protein [Bdellovibrio svalbardensis]
MRLTFIISFLATLILSCSGYGKVQVAFFEHRTKDGQLQPIEAGGQLYHVAVQYNDKWLNAHPYYGVQEVDDVRKIGDLYSIIEIDQDVPLEKYKAEFGKHFSISDYWENPKSTYCSKLVAQILDLSPTFMKNGNGWGISPDEVYKILSSKPHREVRSCTNLFL